MGNDMEWMRNYNNIREKKKPKNRKRFLGEEDGGGNSPSYLQLSWSHKYFL